MTTRPPSPARSLLLACALALVPGCGRDAPASDEGGKGGIRWVAAGPGSAREVQRVREIELAPGVDTWRVEGMPARHAPELLLQLRAKEPSAQTRVIIDGEFDPRLFNRVVVRASSANDVQVGAIFSSDGEFRVTTEKHLRIAGHGARGPGAAQARPPEVANLAVQPSRDQTPFTRMVLLFSGETPALDIHSIDLFHEPVLAKLPSLEDPALVSLAEMQFRSVGLSNKEPVEASFEAGHAGDVHLAAAIPVALRTGGPPLALRVTVRGQSVEETREVELENGRARGLEWHEIRIPVNRGPVQVRAELLDNGSGRPAVCALSEPRLVASTTAAPPAAPTVLLITSDTHRADHVQAAGLGVELATPTLDALAERGIYFENCYSTTNVTHPSHVAIMTSFGSRDSGIVDNMSRLSGEATTLAELFRAQGWTTYASLSVRTMGMTEFGIGQGFDRLGSPTEPTRIASETVAQLESWLPDARGEPLFVWLHVFDAHAPYEPPGEFDRLYYEGGRDPFDPELPDPGLPEGLLMPWIEGVRDFEFPDAQYRAEISYLDSELGRVLAMERFRDAIVAMTADHGETLGHNNIYWDHAELYPSNLHVPLILAWPEAPRGTRVTKAVLNNQLGRTLLDLAGLEQVEFGGETLLAALEADYPADRPRFVLSANSSSASMTYQGWHLILHLRRHWHGVTRVLDPVPKHAVQLYELAADPNCEHERTADEHERAKAMRARLIEWLGAGRSTGWSAGASQDSQMLAELAQLGYVTTAPEPGATVLFDPDCACQNCQRFE